MPSGSHGSSVSHSFSGSSGSHTSTMTKSEMAMHYNSSRFIYRPMYFFYHGRYYRTTPKQISKMATSLIVFVAFVFFSLIFLGVSFGNKENIQSTIYDYEVKYAELIYKAENNIDGYEIIKGYVTRIEYDEEYKGYLYYYHFSDNPGVSEGWTFCMYNEEEIDNYYYLKEIDIASEKAPEYINSNTDTVPMDFKGADYHNDYAYKSYIKNQKAFNIIVPILFIVDGVVLLISLSMLIPKKTSKEAFETFKEAKKNNFENKEKPTTEIKFEETDELEYCDYCGKKIKKNTERCPFCNSKLR